MKEKKLDLEPELQQENTDNLTEETTNNQQEENGTEEDTVVEADNLTEELAKMQDTYLRLMAEYDNYRKRTLKEKADLIKNGGESVLIGFLPVLDDLERALDNMEKSTDMEAVKEGIRLIYNKLIAFLNKSGVKIIAVENQPFNDETAEAVATFPAPEEEMKGKVIECVQTGYKLHDKVIRHAKVVVAE